VLKRTGYEVAELGLPAALLVRGLPWHHKDPFDRLLIAQALDRGYTIVSRDGAFEAYGVRVLRA
jgi:PIN domain nuclease of toxin-antitoxin system